MCVCMCVCEWPVGWVWGSPGPAGGSCKAGPWLSDASVHSCPCNVLVGPASPGQVQTGAAQATSVARGWWARRPSPREGLDSRRVLLVPTGLVKPQGPPSQHGMQPKMPSTFCPSVPFLPARPVEPWREEEEGSVSPNRHPLGTAGNEGGVPGPPGPPPGLPSFRQLQTRPVQES